MKTKTKIFAGITHGNELYFLEIDRANGKRNGYNEFSVCGFTVKPIELQEAKDMSRDHIEQSIEEETKTINPLYLRNTEEILQEIIDSDDNLSGIDMSLFPEIVEMDDSTEKYVFISCSCGQHEEKELKHYFINENLYKQLLKIWQRYHLKELPQNSAMSIVEGALMIKQDHRELAKKAVEIIKKEDNQ